MSNQTNNEYNYEEMNNQMSEQGNRIFYCKYILAIGILIVLILTGIFVFIIPYTTQSFVCEAKSLAVSGDCKCIGVICANNTTCCGINGSCPRDVLPLGCLFTTGNCYNMSFTYKVDQHNERIFQCNLSSKLCILSYTSILTHTPHVPCWRRKKDHGFYFVVERGDDKIGSFPYFFGVILSMFSLSACLTTTIYMLITVSNNSRRQQHSDEMQQFTLSSTN